MGRKNDDYAFVPEIVLTRRPVPAPQPSFVCVICQREISADPWWNAERYPFRHRPPVCFGCANIDGAQVRPKGITRGDHHMLQRLTAITSALTRETYRGQFAK